MINILSSHRARSIASKRLASQSASAISEILGIAPTPSSSSSASPLPQSMQMPGTLTLLDGEHTLEKLTTSTKSVADYFKDRLRAKGSGSSSPLLSTGSEKDDESSEASKRGLGSSRLGLGARVDGQTSTVGLGASKFGSLVSGAFLASLPTVSTVEKLDDAASNEGGEKKKKKKSDKREQDETGNKSSEWPEPSGFDEKLKRKEMINKQRKKDEQKPASTNEVATKMSDKGARRKEKAERKAAKKATSAAA